MVKHKGRPNINKKHIGICEYHLHKKKAEIHKCRHCHKFFCKEHIRPKPPGLPRFESTDMASRKFMIEYHKPGGHPCLPFLSFWEKRQKEIDKKYDKTLDALTGRKPHDFTKKEEIPEEELEEIKPPKTPPKKEPPKDKPPEVKPPEKPNKPKKPTKCPKCGSDRFAPVDKRIGGYENGMCWDGVKIEWVCLNCREKRRRLIKLGLIGVVVAFFIVFLLLCVQQTEGYQTSQTHLMNSTMTEFYFDNISIENYSNIITPKYSNNVSILGFLKQEKIYESANFATIERYITDSYENKIRLSFGGGVDYGYLFPNNGTTTETYLVNGTLRNINGDLSLKVNNIQEKQRKKNEFEYIKQENQTFAVNLSASFNLNLSYGINRIRSVFGCNNDERSYNFECIKKITCSDGTFDPECSVNKPLQCVNGSFVNNSIKCGCPKDTTQNGLSCRSILCEDGTREQECSNNKPKQCINNTLIPNSDKCGCPPDYKKDENSCKKIQRCSDNTIYDECSINKPMFCSNEKLVEKASICGCVTDPKIKQMGDKCIDLSKPDISYLEQKIHNLINVERQKNGLAGLQLDTKLSDIARAHSLDMVNRNFFDHINPDGKDPTDRGKSAGYSCYKDYGSYYTNGLAENIFQGWTYGTIWYTNGIETSREWFTPDDIASSTVDGWMNSPGHRQNILTSTYDKEGIGVAVSGEGEVYVTQDFC